MCPDPIPDGPPPRLGPDDRPLPLLGWGRLPWWPRWFFLSLLFVLITSLIFAALIRASFTVVEPCPDQLGQISVSAVTGFGPLLFTWTSDDPSFMGNPPGDPNQTDLPRGTYHCKIRNKLGLTRTLTIVLAGLEDATLAGTSPSGFLTSDGSIDVTVSPTGAACTFEWDDLTKTEDRTGLGPGVYSVTVTDASNPKCGLIRDHKLLPAYAVPCTDWQDRNSGVHGVREWTRIIIPLGVFAHRNEIQSLLTSSGIRLNDCAGNARLRYTKALPLLEYLGASGSSTTPPESLSYTGPPLDPPAATVPIHGLAAQFLTAQINLRKASGSSVPMADAIYIGNPLYGYTVSRILQMAERALGCGEDEGGRALTAQEFADLHQALMRINDGGFYLACPICTTPFFEPVGDLPGGSFEGDMSDISADGWRTVGYSSADEPLVPNDGPSNDPDSCKHGTQAQGFIRPCAPQRLFPISQGNAGLGLVGLGYLTDPSSTHLESLAQGISPDGVVVVGYASRGGGTCGQNKPVVFTGAAIVELACPDTMTGIAKDVSNAAVVVPVAVDGPFGNCRRIAVGYVTSGSSHSFRTEGAEAVYWDPSGTRHKLDLPTSLPSTPSAILSSEAVAVSDDGSVIVGNLYYAVDSFDGLDEGLSFACVWNANTGGTYDPPVLLQDLPGGPINARLGHVSGNGRVIVGSAWNASTRRAVRWTKTGSTWGTTPSVLPMLPGADRSFADGASYDGSVVVGSCITNDFSLQLAARWTGSTVQNVVDLLAAATPPVNLPTDWQIRANRVSADGKTITGPALGPDGQQGWVGRVP